MRSRRQKTVRNLLLLLAALAIVLGLFPNPLTDWITDLVHTVLEGAAI